MFGIWTFERTDSRWPRARLILPILATACLLATEAAAQDRVRSPGSEFEEMTRDSADLQSNLIELVCSSWHHGMPRSKVIELGSDTLPLLGEMLRSNEYRHCWGSICAAIGAFGDTAYFDTLREFVWTRYKGKVDMGSEFAILTAQGNIAWLAAGSNRAVDYLIRMTDPAAWHAAPWDFPDAGRDHMERRLARTAINSLSYVDDERAREFIETLSVQEYAAAIRPPVNGGAPTSTNDDSLHVQSLRRVSRDVHSIGLRQWSQAQEERLH